ncbi:MAG TPA: multidrug transporter [Synechococcales bacterium UBA10510]|nr:multidrug transporter [Synechococcales bacterium UBA10510]
MATQLLFYNEVAPITAERHSNWHAREVTDFSFAKKTNSVPLMAAEFLSALTDYPIVFAGDEESVPPVLLLGMRNSENAFIGSEGDWKGRYIPAFIRRYPFVLALSDDGEKYYLCIDETFSGFNQSDEGPALITEDGTPTEYTEGVLQFLSQYQAEFERTQAICKKLKDLNLLEAKQVQATSPTGETMTVDGFFAVEPSRLATLSSEAIVDLVRSGTYELICFHLASLRNFELLRDRSLEVQPSTVE